MTNRLIIPISGIHFYPPAREVLTVLPNTSILDLRPEPSNQYDMNAVEVLVDMAEFPVTRCELLDKLLREPFTASELCASGWLKLGYLAASGAKTAKGGPGNMEALLMISTFGMENLEITLHNAPEGYPTVKIQVKE